MTFDKNANRGEPRAVEPYAVPELLRVGRFIPHAGPGRRDYPTVTHRETGQTGTAYAVGKEAGWWPWSPEMDDEIRRNGAELTSAPDGPQLLCMDLDVPVARGGAVLADGMTTLASLALLDGTILDTSGWLVARTPGHPKGKHPKAPGWHCWFLEPPGQRVRTGKMPGHPEVELKRMATCPGSPGYPVVQLPRGLA